MNLQELVVPLKLDKTGFDGGIEQTIKKIASFAAVAAGVTATVAVINKAIDATFKWADEMDSLQDIMEGTNLEAAALNFVLRKSGTATDVLAKGMTILEKGLVKADGSLDSVGEKLKEFGINALDVNGKVKDQTDLIREISAKYNSFSTQQERVNFLTETFGRSGAELIDFFDTLASEGGIDAVAEKVERLGLAIDPNRYEQFNRNLEELRLVGLGIAVAFTEKLMPVLERFLDWAIDISPEVTKFFDTLKLAFERGGLGNMLGVLDRWLANLLDSVDWAGWGTKFGEFIEKALGTGIGEANLPQFAISLGNGIKEFLTAAVGEENLRVFKEHFVDYIRLQLNNVDASFNAWAINTVNTVNQWGQDVVQAITNKLLDLRTTVEDKLREIGKTFFTRALGWTQQMIAGFNNGLPALLGAIRGLVDSINGILRKIITSFTIDIKLPGLPDFGGGGNRGGKKGTSKKGRASGGPVIAGQSYNVAEFFRPEVFTPNVSGRIDKLSANSLQMVQVTNWNEFNYLELATQIVKAQNNV